MIRGSTRSHSLLRRVRCAGDKFEPVGTSIVLGDPCEHFLYRCTNENTRPKPCHVQTSAGYTTLALTPKFSSAPTRGREYAGFDAIPIAEALSTFSGSWSVSGCCGLGS